MSEWPPKDNSGNFGDPFGGSAPNQPQPIALPHQKRSNSASVPPSPHAARHVTSGYGPEFQSPNGPERPGMATASLVIGITSVATCCFGLVLGPLAVILGVLGSRKAPSARGRALWGIITGILGFILCLGVTIWFFATADYETTVTRTGTSETSAPAPAPTEPEEVADPADYEWANLYVGDDVSTPCFSFDALPGYLVNTRQDLVDGCLVEYQFWAEFTAADDGSVVVDRVGVGTIASQLLVDPISEESRTSRFPNGTAEELDAMVESLFATTDTQTVSAASWDTLGGLEARKYEIDSARSDFYVVYVVVTDQAYPSARGESSAFMITFFSARDALVPGAQAHEQVVESFTWR